MRILYHSVSPLTLSGYGRCTTELVYRLLKWFDVDIAAYYGVQQTEITVTLEGKEGPREVKIIGGDGTVWHPLLHRIAREYDLVLDHHDLWFCREQVKQLETPLVWWAIIDHIPLPQPVREVMYAPCMYSTVPMTEWARKVIEDTNDPILCSVVSEPIPHGVDLDFWRNVSHEEDPLPFQEYEYHVVSVVANHGPRENIPTMIEGFAQFLKEYGVDASLYIHADPVTSTGYNLPAIVKMCEELYDVKLRDRIYFKELPKRYTDEFLRRVYSHADVLLMPVMGGSFEIPILEAAACGIPTITTAFSGPGEVVGWGERGIALVPVSWMWMQLSSAKQAIVQPEQIKEALAAYWESPCMRRDHVRKMREWIKENATWDIVAKKWKKELERVETVIERTMSW